MSETVHPAKGPHEFSSIPPLKKTDEEEVVDQIRTGILKGAPIATAPKIDAKLTIETLHEAMQLYLSVKGNKLTVDTEFLAKAIRSFPLLFNILANIKEIPNTNTQSALAKTFLSILENHAGIHRESPQYAQLVEAVKSLLIPN